MQGPLFVILLRMGFTNKLLHTRHDVLGGKVVLEQHNLRNCWFKILVYVDDHVMHKRKIRGLEQKQVVDISGLKGLKAVICFDVKAGRA